MIFVSFDLSSEMKLDRTAISIYKGVISMGHTCHSLLRKQNILPPESLGKNECHEKLAKIRIVGSIIILQRVFLLQQCEYIHSERREKAMSEMRNESLNGIANSSF